MLFKQVLLLACIPCSFYCWNSMESRIMPRDDWTVTMSSTYWSGKRIIDGSNSTLADTCNCCSATNHGNNSTITIDMKYTYMVSKINVYSRTDGPGNQKLNGLILKLDDKTVGSIDVMVESYNFVLNQTTPVRRVTMMINGENRILVLCEVEIYGYDTVISINKPITVSSNYSGWGNFQGAVDGNISTEGTSCTATRNENNPWLRVDLEGVFYITYIIIYGRTDYDSQEQRFDGMTIQTGNKVFKTLPNTKNFYDSGALHVGPSADIKLQLPLPGEKILVVCELLVFGECYDNYYGNCSVPCGHCFGNETCNSVDGTCTKCAYGYTETDRLCETTCPNGTYGYNCTQKCGHCRIGSYCNQTDGACEQCEDGFDETDRTCKTSCEDGTFGNNCTGVCGHCKNKTICNKTNGMCDQCEDGYMETDMLCVKLCPNGTYGCNCSQLCGQCRNEEICSQTNGTCFHCEHGFTETDKSCKTTCKGRTYGFNCTGMCGHCKNGAICNKTNGMCDQCEDGYMETDMLCMEQCSNGTYGANCSNDCGYCSAEEVCRYSDGYCSSCMAGYLYTETDTTCKTEALQDEEGSNYVGAISGTVVGVIVLACLAIGAVIFKRRRYGKEKSQQKYQHKPNDLKDEVRDRGQQNPGFEAVYPDEEEEEEERGTYYNLVPKTQDIPVSKLWSFVYQTRKHGSETLIKQYKDIGEHISPTKEAMAYRYKVRYKDMLPYDHTRVHLEVEEQGECEFINASHIHGFDRQNKFIASQGPMDVMVDDFWRMVWQQDSKKIVMLTNVNENRSVKCIQYWPELGEVITQGRIQITLVKEETTVDYVIRTLELKRDQSRPRVIQQFHYKAWPDKDVPDSAWSLVLFWREVFKENNSSTSPIIVHCSAGVGRTGTFIALDNLYHQALQTGTINPFEIVSSLRTQRLKTVQTQMQYVYLHDAVAESLSIGTHYIWQTQFESYYNYMVKLDKGASQSRLQNQYQLMLDGMKHMKMAMKGGASEEQIYTNSEIDEYKPKAQTSSRYEDVLGGKTLSNYAGKKSFIIMASPNKQEIDRFWNILESRNIKTVVTLTDKSEPTTKLWSSRSSTKQGGSGTNSPILVNEEGEQGLCTRTYEFTKENKSSNNGNGVVKHFELTTSNSGFPNRDTMVKVLHDVFLWHQYLSESEQILIQCRDGEGRSGMMCVLLNEAARMKDEGHIHVLESVTLMKHQVPKIIPNFEQYKYIHDVILDMVKPKDLPAEVNEAEDASIYENVATDKL